MARTRTLVRPATMGDGIREAREALNEENDCVVRAITAASNGAYTYEEVHAICKAAGRKNGEGMWSSQSMPVMQKIGFELRWICGTTITANVQESIAKSLGVNTYRRVKGVTLDRARVGLQNGSYVVCMKGHATCIRRGQVIDNHVMKGGKSVTSVWRFVGKSE